LVCHVLETALQPSTDEISNEAFIRKMQLQYFDVLEDNNDEDWSYVPTGVIDHKISIVPRKEVTHDEQQSTIKIVKERHVRVQACWKSGETSWVAADAMKEQNPWVIVNYVNRRKLTNHPDFAWTKQYLDKNQNKNKNNEYAVKSVNTSGKSHQGMKFKFGVQIPMNSHHALHLDKVHNNYLWRDAIQKEIDSINAFKTFRVLDEGEILPPGYTKNPYHLIYDCKF
jgi:hypothetical protein